MHLGHQLPRWRRGRRIVVDLQPSEKARDAFVWRHRSRRGGQCGHRRGLHFHDDAARSRPVACFCPVRPASPRRNTASDWPARCVPNHYKGAAQGRLRELYDSREQRSPPTRRHRRVRKLSNYQLSLLVGQRIRRPSRRLTKTNYPVVLEHILSDAKFHASSTAWMGS